MRRTLGLLLGLVLLPAVVRAQAPAETIEYYGHDAIGSIRIVWDANGNLVGRQDYAPFGRALFPVPAMPKEGFGGQETDAETDQGYFHARMLQARTGRFTRPDPIQDGLFDPQAWNRYAYALNQPVSVVDPTGLRARDGEWADPSCNDEWRGAPENGPDCFPELWGRQGGYFPGGGRTGGGGRLPPAPPAPPGPAPGPDPGPDPDPDPDPECAAAYGVAAGDCAPGPGPTPTTPCDATKEGACAPSIVKAWVNGFWEGASESCAGQHYGLSGAAIVSTVAAYPVSKRALGLPVLPGASEVTNPLSLVASGLKWRMPIRVMGTTNALRAVARLNPYVALGLMASDIYQIGTCIARSEGY